MASVTGIIPCAKHNTSYISSGVASLDALFGGGIAVGSIIVIEEDADRLYSTIIAKCFLAEGILSSQRTCLLIADESADIFMKNLPSEALSKKPESVTKPNDADKLDIAWRYAKTPGFSNTGASSTGSYFGHKLDISRSLDVDSYKQSALFTAINYEKFLSMHSCSEAFEAALGCIRSAISSSQDSVLRIVLPGFGSPAWGVPSLHHVNHTRADLSLFLSNMRSLIRNTQTVAVVSVQSLILSETPGLRQRLCALADYYFQLESFAASDKEANPAYKDYRGAFRLLKLPLINGTCPIHRPETLDLAFKVRSQNFLIEPLCLPPDLSESASRTMSRGDARTAPGCGSGPGTVADF